MKKLITADDITAIVSVTDPRIRPRRHPCRICKITSESRERFVYIKYMDL